MAGAIYLALCLPLSRLVKALERRQASLPGWSTRTAGWSRSIAPRCWRAIARIAVCPPVSRSRCWSGSAPPSGSWRAFSAASPIATRCAASARWRRRRRCFDATDARPSRSSRSSASTCRCRRVSPNLVSAILAIEDQRFYDHSGVDVVRVAGAALNNVRRGPGRAGRQHDHPAAGPAELPDARQDATPQAEGDRRSPRGSRASSPRTRSSSCISTRSTSATASTASRRRRSATSASTAAELDVAEAALLAGLVKSPSAYAPTVSLERARRPAQRRAPGDARRRRSIDKPPTTRAVKAPVQLDDALRRDEAYGQYFKEEVRRELVERFGWERVYQGGLKVYTTIDLDMQKAAEAEVARAHRRRSRSVRRSAQATPRRRRSAAGGAGRDRSAHRRSARDGRRPRLRAELVQPRDAGEAAARLGVQAVRLRRGARSAATRRPR